MDNNKIDIFNLHKYGQTSIFNIISNYQIIIYFILLIILLFMTKSVNNFSYVFIAFCLISIYIYYLQSISYANYIY